MVHSSRWKSSSKQKNNPLLIPLSDKDKINTLLSGVEIFGYSCSGFESFYAESSHENADLVKEPVYISSRLTCSCCDVSFSSLLEQRTHFKSSWHQCNLKQQINGGHLVLEEQFDLLSNLSSISGSDDNDSTSHDSNSSSIILDNCTDQSDVDNKTADDVCDIRVGGMSMMSVKQQQPKLYLINTKNQVISLYRCVLFHQKMAPSSLSELQSMLEQVKFVNKVAVILFSGGHFSGVLFEGLEVVEHKTFHRYVVRAKGGLAQSSHDSQNSVSHSAGAGIRRHNEAALTKDVRSVLTKWASLLQACHLIFLRATNRNQHIFFGAWPTIVAKDDHRVRRIPFCTRRPTFNEAKRVHRTLMSVECLGESTDSTLDHSPCATVTPDDQVVAGDSVKHRVTGRVAVADCQECDEDRGVLSCRSSHTLAGRICFSPDKVQAAPTSVTSVQDFCRCREHRNSTIGGKTDVTIDHCQEVTALKWETRKKASRHAVIKTESDEFNGHEMNRLRNQLYTCCRTGLNSELKTLMHDLAVGQHHDQSHLAHPVQSCMGQRHSSSGAGNMVDKCDRVPDVSKESAASVYHAEQAVNCEQGGGSIGSASKEASKDLHDTCFTECRRYAERIPGCCFMVGEHAVSGMGKMVDFAEQTLLSRLLCAKYGDESTLLHIAASLGHHDVVFTLLEAGCDPNVRDNRKNTPCCVASTKDVRDAFRRFRGRFPDRYDYHHAQIPAALTAEMETERKVKVAAKKKLQKKSRQEKNLVKKKEIEKATAEEKEKAIFISLPDKEKISFMVETRFHQQLNGDEVHVGNLGYRCFQCGKDISGQVPFEYMQFYFCTVQCLQQHRSKQRSLQ